MTGLEIVLLLLGIAFVVISFFIIDKNASGEKETGLNIGDTEGFAKMGEDIKQNISGEAGRILADAQDKLESLSNDKIIAVGEYSDQVIEKIEADHKEVVFLYQMLCDKEEELKEMTNRMNALKTECERVIREEKEDADRRESLQEEMDKLRAQLEEEKEKARIELENEKARLILEAEKAQENVVAEAVFEPEVSEEPSEEVEVNREPEAAEKPVPEKKAKTVKPAKTVKTAKTSKSSSSTTKAAPAAKAEPVRKGGWDSLKATDTRDTRMLSRNDEIIALYKQNKSVLEISRLLQMGQGEVKLIIDLYCR